LRPKNWSIAVWAACVKKNNFFSIFFFWTSELHILQAFYELGTPNSDSVWACGEGLFKTGIKFIFPVFFEELLHAAMWLKLPKGWRAGAKKKVCFAHRIFDFHFFSLLFFAHGSIWCHLQCDYYDLNVKFFIFVKKVYTVHSVGVLSQDPCQQNKF
jgi:hypothetical protein